MSEYFIRLYVDLTSKSIKYYSNVGWSEIALLIMVVMMMNMMKTLGAGQKINEGSDRDRDM